MSDQAVAKAPVASPEESSPEIHPADLLVPTCEVFAWRHVLSLPESVLGGDSLGQKEKEAAKTSLLGAIEKGALTYVYKDCCTCYDWMEEDPSVMLSYSKRNGEKLAELDASIEKAREQYGDVELKDAKLGKAHYLCFIGNYKVAISEYENLLSEKAMESSGRVKIHLTLARIGLLTGDSKLAADSFSKAEKEFASGGDWETRNRMRVYKALYLACYERKFEEASSLLLSSLATFTASELLSFKEFVTATVLMSMSALPRSIMESNLSKCPEILQVFAEDPVLERFYQSFMSCNYKEFFSSFGAATGKIRRDRFLCPHYRYFVRTMRLNAYKQYLEPYTSINISAMATAFGVNENFIEDQVVSFIPSGKLPCKIDRISRTIQCNSSEEEENTIYLNVVRAGDELINSIQMLSRVIDM